jgi:ABC-type branched-subunit amino acid transport system ATPase component
MIAIRNLSVAFGGVHALNALSVEFDGSIVGVIGPNGAGKTTLLNVFSGFVQPETGSIHAFGTDLLAIPAHRRARWGLRRSFQTEQVVDDLSAADNVRVVLDASSRATRSQAPRLVAEALQFVGLGHRADAPGASLNTFERRMLELAKAVVGEPRVLLLDEPAAGLREEEIEVLRHAIRGVHAHFGAMTLLIEHNVALIASTCVSTVVLDFGALLAFGPTAEVLQSERVKAAYLGLEEAA